MKLHFLQHVSFEDIAHIRTWADSNNITVSKTALYENQPFPALDDFDILVIMGGPMGVYDEAKYEWLKPEKKFIERVISSNKPALGICLGAQLIAEVAGAKVYPNEHKEIGFFEVAITYLDKNGSLFESLPDTFRPFHWHGDTFDIPAGAIRLAASKACRNQAFQLGDRVVGLQFHLESTVKSIRSLIENCSDEITDAPYIQTAQQMIEQVGAIASINPIMDTVMYNMAESIQ